MTVETPQAGQAQQAPAQSAATSTPAGYTGFESPRTGPSSPTSVGDVPQLHAVASLSSSFGAESNALAGQALKYKEERRKRYCLGVLATFLAISILFLVGYIVGYEVSKNEYDGANNSGKVTSSMVLPNVTLTIGKLTDSHSKGTITFSGKYEHNMVFTWNSLYNATDDIISFHWQSDDFDNTNGITDEAFSYYNTYLNGISGFEIDLKGDDNLQATQTTTGSPFDGTSEPTSATMTTSGANVVKLTCYVTKFGSDEVTEVIVTSEDADDAGDVDWSDTEYALLESMVTGYIGEYFVELGLKLGSLGLMGSDYNSLRFIYNYGKFFLRNAGDGDAANWNFTMIEEATELNNIIVLENGTISDDIEEIEPVDESDGSSRRLLGYPEHCPSSTPYNNCGNGCFGMCGYGCDCWSWFCGHCGCVNDCHWHDWYCSCDSMWNFWCINVFWVNC